ncbi:hypothetical protein CLIM01_12379 [Colletotrichum limetticola]|uniref:Secreted protein n=1 Tax=Colletotrichum limetticola TaxID=1209924 RepID=A0ABQ9PK03_9PEZI|nr:hypothetical protein CLIM01_12379 [Colletotrichum limetticola]
MASCLLACLASCLALLRRGGSLHSPISLLLPRYSSSSRSIAELDPWFILASAYWSDVVLTSVDVCPLLGSPLVVTLTSQLTGRGPRWCTEHCSVLNSVTLSS